jgi:hypothetical protein
VLFDSSRRITLQPARGSSADVGFNGVAHARCGVALNREELSSSDMPGDALRRVERYGSIGNEAVAIQCVEGKEIAIIFSYGGVARHSEHQQIECFMTALIRTYR